MGQLGVWLFRLEKKVTSTVCCGSIVFNKQALNEHVNTASIMQLYSIFRILHAATHVVSCRCSAVLAGFFMRLHENRGNLQILLNCCVRTILHAAIIPAPLHLQAAMITVQLTFPAVDRQLSTCTLLLNTSGTHRHAGMASRAATIRAL